MLHWFKYTLSLFVHFKINYCNKLFIIVYGVGHKECLIDIIFYEGGHADNQFSKPWYDTLIAACYPFNTFLNWHLVRDALRA